MRGAYTQRGAAIVAALLTVALVAGLSVAAFWQQWRSIEVEQGQRQRLQAQWLITGALDWARARVGDDGVRSPALDHAGEAWAQPVRDASLAQFLSQRSAAPGQAPAPVPTDEARLDLEIVDAQGRLNLLNLLEGQALSPPWLAVFGRLFDSLGLPPEQLKLLAEQLRQANLGTTASGSGAGVTSVGAANAPLIPTRQADLAWLGLAPATVQALSPHVSLLPGRLPVNLNTASATVLQAVLDLPLAEVQPLLGRRQAQPFANLAATGLQAPNEQVQQMLSVNTHYFEVQVRLRLGGGAALALREHALLQRDGRDVRTLWQRREAPQPLAAPSSAQAQP